MALAAEALARLLAARRWVLGRTLKQIAARLEQLPHRDDSVDRDVSADIAWAIGAVARRLPLRLLCYERGIAAFQMLSARGLSATFHYGVGRNEADLSAHVWVTSGTLPVIGCGEADGYREVLTLTR